MGKVNREPFDTAAFLAAEGPGRSISNYTATQIFFSQGGPADSVFYLQTGRAKLTVISKGGKEATVTLLVAGDFFGEESVAGAGTLRTVTASAITACTVLKIATAKILRVLQTEHKFSTFFLKFIVIRGMRTQADLIDQLFNSSEKRLARTLLLMAEYGEPGAPETLIPPVTRLLQKSRLTGEIMGKCPRGERGHFSWALYKVKGGPRVRCFRWCWTIWFRATTFAA